MTDEKFVSKRHKNTRRNFWFPDEMYEDLQKLKEQLYVQQGYDVSVTQVMLMCVRAGLKQYKE